MVSRAAMYPSRITTSATKATIATVVSSGDVLKMLTTITTMKTTNTATVNHGGRKGSPLSERQRLRSMPALSVCPMSVIVSPTSSSQRSRCLFRWRYSHQWSRPSRAPAGADSNRTGTQRRLARCPHSPRVGGQLPGTVRRSRPLPRLARHTANHDRHGQHARYQSQSGHRDDQALGRDSDSPVCGDLR